MKWNDKNQVVVTINYQRYLCSANKVQQIVEAISLLQPVSFASDEDDNSFYQLEDLANFSVTLLDREVKQKGE